MFRSNAASPTFYPRFQFRKTRSEEDESPGIIQVMLVFPDPNPKKRAVEYGPYSTQIITTRQHWDERRYVRLSTEARELKRKLANYEDDLFRVYDYLQHQQQEHQDSSLIDGPALMNAYYRFLEGDLRPITLPEVYQQFYAAKKDIVEPNRRKRKTGQISEGTLKTYPKRWALIMQFLHAQKTPKLPVRSVNYRFATELKEWMMRQSQSRRYKAGYDPATVHKVIGLLKMLLVYAQSKEYIQVNPLLSFKTEGGSVANPKPLTSFQMELLETCDLPPMLRYQCDSWLVAAELCFHYADYMELPKMAFITSESGIEMVQHERAKQTGRSLLQTVNITPRAARLLDKYSGPKGLYYGSSAYFSKVLKKIAELADLRDSEGNIVRLQFGQGRDTGLTQRAIQGGNNLQLAQIAGWTKAGHADKYINNPVAIVEGFAQKQPEARHWQLSGRDN